MTVPEEDDRQPAKVNVEWTLEQSMQSLKNALGYQAEDHDGFSADIHSTTSTNLSPGNAGDRLASKISKKETK